LLSRDSPDDFLTSESFMLAHIIAIFWIAWKPRFEERAGGRRGCMSAFAGYAHGSKSSMGEPGDSVLECGGREALENGVPSREGQIMDGTTIELTEKLERLLREAAQVSVDL